MGINNFSLRVALVWRGTVYEERSFVRTSEPVVTVGEADENVFDAPAAGLPERFEMFEREDRGYTLRFTDRIAGTVTIDGREYSLEDLVDERAVAAESVTTPAGGAQVYEVRLREGDWGLLELGDNELYFQMMERPEAVAGRGFKGLDLPLVGTLGAVALAHIVFLVVAFLAFDIDPDLTRRQIPDKFVDFTVDDVEDPLEEEESEQPSEDTTGKRAGGEAGKFGKEDSEVAESKVPRKKTGEMKKEIEPEKVGLNKMLASKKLGGSGAVQQLFGNQDGFDSKMDVAMAGQADELKVGRGPGGMAMRGTGSGGGGPDGSFGRIGGVGEVDTGPGVGTGAKTPTKQKRKVTPKVERGTPVAGDFCDPADIRKVVSAKAARIKYCYERQLQQNPQLKGKISVQWKIGLDGQVKSASVANSTMGNRAVASCIVRAVKRMRFAQPDGGICIISYPFVFTGVE